MKQKRGLIVLSIVLLLLSFSLPGALSIREGCYFYPQASEDWYCQARVTDTNAQEDCQDHEDCDFEQYFQAGSDCSDISECQQVLCNVDCQLQPLGKCQAQGGAEIPAGEEPVWCNVGCCRIDSANFCQYGLNRFECTQKATQLGSSQPLFVNEGMNNNLCYQSLCQITAAPGTLVVTVTGTSDVPISNAQVVLQGTALAGDTNNTGTLTFLNVTAQTYQVDVQAVGYLPQVVSATVLYGETKSVTINLLPATGSGSISGKVSSTAIGLAGATISYSGPLRGIITTNNNGDYRIQDVPAGQYTLIASKAGYTREEKIVSLTANEQKTNINFNLRPDLSNRVSGTTYLRERDGSEEEVSGVALYLNGVFKGFSLNGEYSITVPQQGVEYTLTATYHRYSVQERITLGPSGMLVQDLYLEQVEEICGPGNEKNVENVTASHILGSSEVLLRWSKPCPEVIGYTIIKKHAGITSEISASLAQRQYIDEDVQWGGTYTYAIIANYNSDSQAAPSAEQTIRLGNALCEGRYHAPPAGNGWETFCLPEEDPQRVWTCNNVNEKEPGRDCRIQGERFFCAPISTVSAQCKEDTQCLISNAPGIINAGDPFGLYYTRSACYGSQGGSENFCYYDYSESIVNRCQSCRAEGNVVQSCFDYRSRDACTTNNCLTDKCLWIDSASNTQLVDYSALTSLGLSALPQFVTNETGTGFCVAQDYNNTDKCSLCGPSSTLFENYLCTADICQGLGRCFSDTATGLFESDEVSQCSSCGSRPSRESNCYEYSTQLECTGSATFSGMSVNPAGELAFADDSCGWKRCAWRGSRNVFDRDGCFKDGNGDQQDDCAPFARTGEWQTCATDLISPRTTVSNTGTIVISQAFPNVTFHGKDDLNWLGRVGYCIAPAVPRGTCTDFEYTSYSEGLREEQLQVQLFNSSWLRDPIEGEAMLLRFFSLDRYSNQEQVQEVVLFVDNVPPQFEVVVGNTTRGDTTSLQVDLLGASEPMSCVLTLDQLLPRGDQQVQRLARDLTVKRAQFPNLNGIKYVLDVTCKDDRGNANTQQREFVFDQEGRITIVSPQGVLSTGNLRFEINSAVGALCSLYRTDTNEKLADFITNEEGKIHRTEILPGFSEGRYAATHKVVCTELFTNEEFEDYFDFTIDVTPPTTKIMLQEGTRQRTPLRYGWEEFFISTATVSFQCQTAGFACSATYYCLGERCDRMTASFREYTAPFQIINTTKICYYSSDVAQNRVYSPWCGTIKIEGYGITLENPPLHYVAGKQWGVSNQNKFTWQFSTRVPTKECRFDFTSGFNYENVPDYKRLFPNAQGKYIFTDFPGTIITPYPEQGGIKTIYLKCTNHDDQIGPEQDIYLEYDPTAPIIELAEADPDLIYEGISTQLRVETNDKTLCKYDQESNSYDTMRYSFPDTIEKYLRQQHQDTFYLRLTSSTGKEDFSLKTQCVNGAGDLSQTENISFSVDYTQEGFILPHSLQPRGVTSARNITLALQTSKQATCSYKLNTTEFIPFSNAGMIHSAVVGDLAERDYLYLIKCIMSESGSIATATISFKVDRTAPIVTRVDDGNFTCGNDQMRVMVYTSEGNISQYDYKIYEAGTGNTTGRILVRNATVGSNLPLSIPTSGLTLGKRYLIAVRAQDAVGYYSEFVESDGVMLTARNATSCHQDTSAPRITIAQNTSSCTAVSTELICEDGSGCSTLLYGKAFSSLSCNATIPYNGQQLLFDANSWLCYYVEDYTRHNYSSVIRITVQDEDGDGVLDSCDTCPATQRGRAVDGVGCSISDTPDTERGKDTDRDGLPDAWEKLHSAQACELNHRSPDSDGDTIIDRDEDYDNDTYNNFQEYGALTDPCSADDVPAPEQAPPFSPPTIVETAGNILPWILLFVGLVLFFAGSGYLLYVYKVQNKTQRQVSTSRVRASSFEKTAPTPLIQSWKNQILALRKERKEKQQQRQRATVFNAFNQESKTIPHVEEILQKKAAHLSKLQDLAQHYAEHRDDIKPGLKPEEKNIFSRLDSITKQTKTKDITEVVSKDEAKDIFNQLRDVSEKRKHKK